MYRARDEPIEHRDWRSFERDPRDPLWRRLEPVWQIPEPSYPALLEDFASSIQWFAFVRWEIIPERFN